MTETPPRKHVTVAQDPLRVDLLREYVTTESEIADLKRMDLDEALFRIGHECEVHIAWARRKKAFLADEVRASRKITGRAGGTVEFVQPRDPRDRRDDNEVIGAIKLT